MRIRTLIIRTLSAAILAMLVLSGTSISASWKLAQLSRVDARAQAAATEVTTLLILTHEYALHREPRSQCGLRYGDHGVADVLLEPR